MTEHVAIVLLFCFEALVLLNGQMTQSHHFTEDKNVSNQITEFWMFEESPIFLDPPTILECAVKCTKEERCITFMVNLNSSKLCRLHAARVTAFNTLKQAVGFRTFFSSRADSYIGHPCTTSDVCAINHTECVDNICQCQAGYSFSPTLKSCVTDCPTYGTEFVGFKDYYISRHNNLELNDTQSICPGCCQQRCVQETSFLCRSTEAMPTKCMLTNVTKFDVPGSYHFHTSLSIVHYQRQCSYD